MFVSGRQARTRRPETRLAFEINIIKESEKKKRKSSPAAAGQQIGAYSPSPD
jgi:hypothetical protein